MKLSANIIVPIHGGLIDPLGSDLVEFVFRQIRGKTPYHDLELHIRILLRLSSLKTWASSRTACSDTGGMTARVDS